MMEKLLICTDLDRTLIPNGPQSESPGARKHFTTLVNRPEVTLTYVSGRHRSLIEKAIVNYSLPLPDFVVGDVGTSIYHVGARQDWQRQSAWEDKIASDWGNKGHADLKVLLKGIQDLRLQENTKQNRFKLSYYVPLQSNRDTLSVQIRERLSRENVRASLIWSVDEPNGIGLLDILPQGATKFHAVEALMNENGFDLDCTVFCGDSGNDIEVMTSPIPSVLVANSQEEVKQLARRLAASNGESERLYIARGGFMGMNGNYAAGMLEGIGHYYPDTINWMGFQNPLGTSS
jgi:sucrose-6F-phosphate phosphohydrolase